MPISYILASYQNSLPSEWDLQCFRFYKPSLKFLCEHAYETKDTLLLLQGGWSTCRSLFSRHCSKTILKLQTCTEGQYFQPGVSDLPTLSFYFYLITVETWNKFPYLRLRLLTWLWISPRHLVVVSISPCNTRSDIPLCIGENWSQDVTPIP